MRRQRDGEMARRTPGQRVARWVRVAVATLRGKVDGGPEGLRVPWWCRFPAGWHLNVERSGFDGCSHEGRCLDCGRRVLLDSQGNWFEMEERS